MVFWNTHRQRRLLALAVAAFACLPAAAGPRVLAIDGTSAGLQAAPQRRGEIEQMLQAWKLAWELGEADTYLRFYAPDFRGDARSRADWERTRRARLARRRISVELESLRIRLLGDSEAEVSFTQRYAAGGHRDTGAKRLRLQRIGGAWRITGETWAQGS
ncbi:nuclear transport factor 2 family protein [Ramlibacter alkalitolerans]|uniref:Nuclear transport factor 2 family protein n=1 Tax=Ramlibacter alkalitolerans TaxID=2039631 RepID=A0ABS1JUQ8_9BURK|nr:nuclear transport factor 2 family protein [Ramlibacter alkalitolerans]MBL0427606.1 nuclear transport factor 2 family protein [Ramlibacter alkalitolerans]